MYFGYSIKIVRFEEERSRFEDVRERFNTENTRFKDARHRFDEESTRLGRLVRDLDNLERVARDPIRTAAGQFNAMLPEFLRRDLGGQ